MPLLQLILAPNPIFKMKSEPVSVFDESVKALASDMLETIYAAHAIGMAANMAGILKRIIVIDLQDKEIREPLIMVNPEITWTSNKMSTQVEASICYPGISAEVTRPQSIKVSYSDENGNKTEDFEAEGFFATVIQHEIDYLNGKVYLDYLSKMKRDMLLKKMQKFIKMHPPHVHTEHCNH